MDNISATIDAHLSREWVRRLRTIANVASERGLRAYLVGGGVRDMLLGLPVVDMDIAVERADADFAAAVAVALGGEVAAESQFNTFALRLASERLDIAMVRSETYAHPGALPSVLPAAIGSDLARRDFSINAMAVSLGASDWGVLLDPFCGCADLRRQVIRVLHDDSFADDATRILRAVRYASRLGFALDAHTKRLLQRDLQHIGSMSSARIWHELERILSERNAADMLRTAQRLGVLAAVHPALAASQEAMDAVGRIADEYAGVQSRPGSGSDRVEVMLAALMYCSSNPHHAALAHRLGLGARTARTIQDAAAIRGLTKTLSRKGLRRSELHGLLMPYATAALAGCAFAADASGRTIVAGRIRLYLDELRHERPLLNGNALLALGVRQGPRVGMLLTALLQARLDGALTSRQDEIAFVRRCLAQDARNA